MRTPTRNDESRGTVVFTTLGTEKAARVLVRKLVEKRLAACGTVIPGTTSIFRWKGEITEETEVLVILKTVRARWQDLEVAIAEHHPYEVPELIEVPITQGLPKYLTWLSDETTSNER